LNLLLLETEKGCKTYFENFTKCSPTMMQGLTEAINNVPVEEVLSMRQKVKSAKASKKTPKAAVKKAKKA